jgi:hypothetical protein
LKFSFPENLIADLSLYASKIKNNNNKTLEIPFEVKRKASFNLLLHKISKINWNNLFYLFLNYKYFSVSSLIISISINLVFFDTFFDNKFKFKYFKISRN